MGSQRAVTVIIAAAIATAMLLALLLGTGFSHTPNNTQTAQGTSSRAQTASDPTQPTVEQAIPTQRSVIHSDSAAVVMVKTVDGLAIEGAIAEPIPTGIEIDDVGPQTSTTPYWQSDHLGACRVEPALAPNGILIRAALHMPQVLRRLDPSATQQVVLAPVFATKVRVRDQDGAPVAGFGIGVAFGVSESREFAAATVAQGNGPFRIAGQGMVALGSTDRTGVLTLLLPSGLHTPHLNTGRMLVGVQRSKANVAFAAGGQYELVVLEPLACVVSIQGDAIVSHAIAPVGVSFSGDKTSANARGLVLADLRHRFPGCIVSCEMPGNGNSSVRIYTLGTHSGVQEHSIPYVKFTAIKSPTVLNVETRAAKQVGSALVTVRNPDGKELTLKEGELRFVSTRNGHPVAFPSCSGTEVELPLGDIEFREGTSGVPLLLIPRVNATVQSQAITRIRIDLPRPMFRVRLTFHTSSGGTLLNSEVEYGTGNATRRRIMWEGDTIESWMEVDSTVRFTCGKKRVSEALKINTNADPNVAQDFRFVVD